MPILVNLPHAKMGATSIPTWLDIWVRFAVRVAKSVNLTDKHIRERHGADHPRQARDLYMLMDKVYLQSWVQEGSRR